MHMKTHILLKKIIHVNFLKNVVLGKNITELPDTFCYMAQNLVNIEMHGDVTTIGKQAFYFPHSMKIKFI